MYFFANTNKLFSDNEFAYGEQKDGDFNTGEAEFCKVCGHPISMLEWLSPLSIRVSSKALGDFIFGTYVGFILSERVLNLYENSGLTGLSNFRSVDIFYRGNLLKEKYYYPKIKIINAYVDYSSFIFSKIDKCSFCQKGGSIIDKINGVSFLHKEQISSDIFFTTSIGQGVFFVSEFFKKMIENNRLSNFSLIESQKYSFGEFHI
ncbi:MAG: hypothetical protein ED557_14590 [Balneola sp.]|nr:MAG: hypothetical protein ED557_14590 [Balneola sp.]